MRGFAIVFPGQGGRLKGYSDLEYRQHGFVRRLYQQVSEKMKVDLHQMLSSGDALDLTRTTLAQPITFLLSLSRALIVEHEHGFMPAVVAGHSFGEITALTYAGAIRIEDALDIIKVRGEQMEICAKEEPGGMLAVIDCSLNRIKEHCWLLTRGTDHELVVSNINSSHQVVVSGHLDPLIKLEKTLSKEKIRTSQLKVAGAFHSSLMASAKTSLQAELDRINVYPMKTQALNHTTGNAYEDHNQIPQTLAQQLVSPVRWDLCMRNIFSHCDYCIDTSLNAHLKKFAEQMGMKNFAFPFSSVGNIKQSTQQLHKNAEIVAHCLAILAGTRNNQHDLEAYTEGAAEPYIRLSEVYTKAVANPVTISDQDVEKTINLTTDILMKKGINEHEIRDRKKYLKTISETRHSTVIQLAQTNGSAF